MTLGSKPEPSVLSASLPQQTGRDEILPPDRAISFLFLIIRHISALIDVYHRQMTFRLACHYSMFASSKLSNSFFTKELLKCHCLKVERSNQVHIPSLLHTTITLQFQIYHFIFPSNRPENTV